MGRAAALLKQQQSLEATEPAERFCMQKIWHKERIVTFLEVHHFSCRLCDAASSVNGKYGEAVAAGGRQADFRAYFG